MENKATLYTLESLTMRYQLWVKMQSVVYGRVNWFNHFGNFWQYIANWTKLCSLFLGRKKKKTYTHSPTDIYTKYHKTNMCNRQTQGTQMFINNRMDFCGLPKGVTGLRNCYTHSYNLTERYSSELQNHCCCLKLNSLISKCFSVCCVLLVVLKWLFLIVLSSFIRTEFADLLFCHTKVKILMVKFWKKWKIWWRRWNELHFQVPWHLWQFKYD